MNKEFLKTKGKVLTLLLALFGIGSCTDNQRVAYGTPTANYKISGKVVNSQDEPVSGIEVKINNKYGFQNNYSGTPTQLTDENGEYSFFETGFPASSVDVTFSDIDGEDNGNYSDISKSIDTKFEDGDDSWSEGTSTNTVDAKLIEKTSENE